MKTSLFRFCGVLLLAAMLAPVCVHARKNPKNPKNNMRLLYWNIQNGMWSGQGDNYDKFVEWVRAYDPDVCVWCEAQSIYKTGTADKMDVADRYLVGNWGELAARYGHKYWYVGGHRDNYPQVITSKYPIENVERIVGSKPDSVVTHGAGWARIEKNGKTVNIVTLHTWPQGYAFEAKDRDASPCRERRRQIPPHGDGIHLQPYDPFGSGRRKAVLDDDGRFQRAFVARQLVLQISGGRHAFPGARLHSPAHALCGRDRREISRGVQDHDGGKSRIDFVYCTPPLYERITHADVVTDAYTEPVRDPAKLSNFWAPLGPPSDRGGLQYEMRQRIK